MKEVKYPNLKAEMARRGENQRTIGKLLDLNNTTICRKLLGQIAWSVNEIDILCEHFGKNYYELFK